MTLSAFSFLLDSAIINDISLQRTTLFAKQDRVPDCLFCQAQIITTTMKRLVCHAATQACSVVATIKQLVAPTHPCCVLLHHTHRGPYPSTVL